MKIAKIVSSEPVHLDAGGQYAANLEHFLRASHLPITFSVGEPKRNKDYHRAVSPKRKSDASLAGSVAEALVRQGVAEVQHAQQGQASLEKLLSETFSALPASGHSQVVTIAGIGQATAAVLVAKIISIDRFETAENLVGYFGVFPEEYSSGVDRQGRPQRSPSHMSRKGNDLVRRYLFCAAKSAIVPTTQQYGRSMHGSEHAARAVM